MLERTQVERTIKNAGYNSTDMTQQQRLTVGRRLTASIIVVGDVNLFMNKYSIDVRAISVETGATIASNPVSFKPADYRNNVISLAKALADKISQRGRHVPPRDYVDLGLPSGTYWKECNESGFFTFDGAVQRFGNKLPSQAQWQELKDYCEWQWTGSGYKVIGTNGKSMVLPASVFRSCRGDVVYIDSGGNYWSSTPDGSDNAWKLGFDSDRVRIYSFRRCRGYSVRLVQD